MGAYICLDAVQLDGRIRCLPPGSNAERGLCAEFDEGGKALQVLAEMGDIHGSPPHIGQHDQTWLKDYRQVIEGRLRSKYMSAFWACSGRAELIRRHACDVPHQMSSRASKLHRAARRG